MTATLFIFSLIVGVLVVLLLWALRSPRRVSPAKFDLASLEETGRRHATYFALIRQASSAEDIEFLTQRGSPELALRVRKERRRATLIYLAQLRDDFQRLLRMARAVAALSPSVGVRQELERLWLGWQFSLHYHLIRAALYYGPWPIPRLNALSSMVSQLAVQMEASIKELGERAAVAAGMASSFDGNSVDAA